MIPFGGPVLFRVSRHVLTCTCLGRTWHEALSCPVWIDSHVYMFGLGLIYLSTLWWSRCTPSLRTGNITIISIIVVVVNGFATHCYAHLPSYQASSLLDASLYLGLCCFGADAWQMGTAGGKPEVKYIKGSAEQRGTNFRAAMTGDESFRR
jgi:hypothetical protein